MAAPSKAALLDYETNYEVALKAYLDAAFPAYQVLTAETLASAEPKLATPRIELQLTVTGTGTAEHQRNTDNAIYKSQKTGVLRIRAVARRNGTGQHLGTMRGQIRNAMLEATQALDDTALPYYQTIGIEESGSTRDIAADNDEVQTEVEFTISWWIRNDIWPVS